MSAVGADSDSQFINASLLGARPAAVGGPNGVTARVTLWAGRGGNSRAKEVPQGRRDGHAWRWDIDGKSDGCCEIRDVV